MTPKKRGVRVLALDLLSFVVWVCPCVSWVVAGSLGPVVWSCPAWSSARLFRCLFPRTDLSARHPLTPEVQGYGMLWPWFGLLAG